MTVLEVVTAFQKYAKPIFVYPDVKLSVSVSASSHLWTGFKCLCDTSSWSLFLHTYLVSYFALFLNSSFKSAGSFLWSNRQNWFTFLPASCGMCRKRLQLLTFSFISWLPGRHGAACCVLGDSRNVSSASQPSVQCSKRHVAYLPQKETFLCCVLIQWISECFLLFICQFHIYLFKLVKLLNSFLCLFNSWHLSVMHW